MPGPLGRYRGKGMKPPGWVNLLLMAALVILWAAYAWLKVDTQKRNPYWLEGMVDTPAFAAQTANPFFADHKTEQEPPAGTVVRHLPPLHLEAGPAGQAKAGRLLVNPYRDSDSAAVDRGQTAYSHTCLACHGPQGEGDGPVPGHGFPRPPSLLAAHAQGMKDGSIFHMITLGDGVMPPYQVQLSREDRWKVVLF